MLKPQRHQDTKEEQATLNMVSLRFSVPLRLCGKKTNTSHVHGLDDWMRNISYSTFIYGK